MMRVVEALEGKGFRMPLTKGEAQLGIRLRNLAQQVGNFHLYVLDYLYSSWPQSVFSFMIPFLNFMRHTV